MNRLELLHTRFRICAILSVIALALMLLTPPSSVADPSFAFKVDVPTTIGVGQPFLVRISSAYPLNDITISWDKRTVHPQIKRVDNLSRAIVLLGTGVALEPAPMTLKVYAQAMGRTAHFKKNINVVAHSYQCETLSVAPRMLTPPSSEKERLQRDRERMLKVLHSMSPQRMWTAPFQLPTKGKMLSRFGLHRVFNGEVKKRHKGLDFRAPLGTPIHSIAAGKVVLVGEFYYGGNMIVVDHGNGVVSSYAHMSEVAVAEGAIVTQGQKIGLSGATGRVTGAHLHLSVYAQGRSIDPEPLFQMIE